MLRLKNSWRIIRGEMLDVRSKLEDPSWAKSGRYFDAC